MQETTNAYRCSSKVINEHSVTVLLEICCQAETLQDRELVFVAMKIFGFWLLLESRMNQGVSSTGINKQYWP